VNAEPRKCKMYDEENCPSNCKSTWPTCNVCGKTLDFWNGDEFDAANVYIITEAGMNCDESEDIDRCYHLCPACYEKVKAFIEGLKVLAKPNDPGTCYCGAEGDHPFDGSHSGTPKPEESANHEDFDTGQDPALDEDE